VHKVLTQNVPVDSALRWLRKALIAAAIVLSLLALLAWRVWQIRGTVEDIGWPEAMVASDAGGGVTATWLGISTILFDDGETQILIDGAFTRVHPLDALLFRRVKSDVATINYAMTNFGINRLAAIIPVHSHHDHAMDAGHVANRSTAIVLGSESTANIVRGADVPVDQYQILADGEERQFGEFNIRLIASVHAPIGADGQEIFPGIIELPLRQPARISEYRTGVAWTALISHPRGTTLVQGSGGFVDGKLSGIAADVVMLGLGGLASLGESYTKTYWHETVTATDPARVIAIHFDDFSAPFGEVRLLPDVLDQVLETAGWIDGLAIESGIDVELPPFGQPMLLY
jgi:L-ascorbate metabolism protein UlaG (beta-lactamase superfamily)